MSAPALEALLARLYSDKVFRARFLASALETAREAGLDEREANALAAIDRTGLEMAARSYEAKRGGRA